MKRTSSMIFSLVLVLSLVLIMAGPMATPVQATDKVSGPNNGEDAVNDTLTGGVGWGTPLNALTQNNNYAFALLLPSNNTSYYLKVTDFGFDIPSTADITGIKVEVDRWAASGTTVKDNSIRLVQVDTITGDDGNADAIWPDSDTDNYESYGDSNDLWGVGWTPADINNSDFGVAIQAVLTSGLGNAQVDHVRVTVYYSVDEYTLTMVSSPGVGGDAIDNTNTSPYEAGEVVDIEAIAATGYEFDEWTADPPTPGGFADAEDPVTTFTMPAYAVTVTANFQVPPPPSVLPTVATVAASGITRTTATLNMDFTVGDWSVVSLRFAYREVGTFDWSYSTNWINRTSDGSFPDAVSGLTEDTEYQFRAELKYDNNRLYGAILDFKTDALGGSICFIATAAYGTPNAEQIDVLREFRDSVLLKSTAGSLFVSLYYQLSPPVADFIAGNELVRTLARELMIDPIVWVVEATGDVWRN